MTKVTDVTRVPPARPNAKRWTRSATSTSSKNTGSSSETKFIRDILAAYHEELGRSGSFRAELRAALLGPTPRSNSTTWTRSLPR